ncbi:hypothetical protein [Pilimelia anulata]|nr:hypothetical protein [Pilimelia anulata]
MDRWDYSHSGAGDNVIRSEFPPTAPGVPPTRSLTSRLLIAALAVPAVIAGAAGSALAAGPASPVTDPTGDVIAETGFPTEQPKADIIVANGRRVGAELELGFKTAQPTDPQRDPLWKHVLTGSVFRIDTDNDESFTEFHLVFRAGDKERPTADVWGNGEVLCTAKDAHVDGTNVFTFPLSCIDNPAELYYSAHLSYAQVDDAGGLDASDSAPDSGYAAVD